MTTVFRQRGLQDSRCRECDHDLAARKDGRVYCTNPDCKHHRKPHPTKAATNRGRFGA